MPSKTIAYYDAIEGRRSIYKLSNESTISDSRIEEIVSFAIKHVPSSFNVQSARAVILFKDDHKKFWAIAGEMLKGSVPEEVYGMLGPRIEGFTGAYGTVMFFEDTAALDELAKKNPMITGMIPEWSDHSSGMNQFAVWTAFEAEGLGANLQHYNFMPPLCDRIVAEWKVPNTWKLKSQLVFGKPTGGPSHEKTFSPIEDRVKVFSG